MTTECVYLKVSRDIFDKVLNRELNTLKVDITDLSRNNNITVHRVIDINITRKLVLRTKGIKERLMAEIDVIDKIKYYYWESDNRYHDELPADPIERKLSVLHTLRIDFKIKINQDTIRLVNYRSGDHFCDLCGKYKDECELTPASLIRYYWEELSWCRFYFEDLCRECIDKFLEQVRYWKIESELQKAFHVSEYGINKLREYNAKIIDPTIPILECNICGHSWSPDIGNNGKLRRSFYVCLKCKDAT